MTDALDLLLTRRSVPAIALSQPVPSDEQIHSLLTAAIRVPDHGKLTPWRFILYRGSELTAIGDRLVALWLAQHPDADASQIEKERTRFSRSPLVIGIVSKAGPHPKIPEWEQVLSAGASTMNLVTAVHAMGFAAQWLTGWYAYDQEASEFLGLTAGERFAGFVHIGTPKEKPAERPRPSPEDLLTIWKP